MRFPFCRLHNVVSTPVTAIGDSYLIGIVIEPISVTCFLGLPCFFLFRLRMKRSCYPKPLYIGSYTFLLRLSTLGVRNIRSVLGCISSQLTLCDTWHLR